MEASGSRPRVRPIVVDFLATLFHTFCIGVGTAVALGACVVLLAGEARGIEIVPMKASEARQGTLLVQRSPGETFAAPLLRSEVAIKVARARVRQSFRNPFAIDRSPARPAERDLKLAALPSRLPEGRNYEAIFGASPDDALLGRLPQGGTDSRFRLLTGALALLLAFLLFRRIEGRQRGWSRRV
jgi:hypothetical protein